MAMRFDTVTSGASGKSKQTQSWRYFCYKKLNLVINDSDFVILGSDLLIHNSVSLDKKLLGKVSKSVKTLGRQRRCDRRRRHGDGVMATALWKRRPHSDVRNCYNLPTEQCFCYNAVG